MAAKKRPQQSAGSKAKGKKPAAQEPKKKFPIGPVIGVVAGLIIVGAVVFSGSPGQEFGDVTIDGDPLAQYTQGNDLAVGSPAPEVSGVDFAGNQVSIRHDGTPKAIVFLAHWCQFCQREVPAVQAWLEATGGVDGVEIIAVATDMNSARANYPPSDWLEREGWTPPVIRDDVDNSALRAYGSGGFPYWVFIDGEGNVLNRNSGQIPITSLEQILAATAAVGASG